MSLDNKTINKIKKEIRKGEKLPDILKKLPELFDNPEKFKEKKPKELSPEQREELKKFGEKFLEKFKEKKKIVPKEKPDPDRKDKKFEDFFKKINPKDRKKFYDIMPYKPDPDLRRFYETLPYKIDPDNPMPKMKPDNKPFIIKPKDKNSPNIVQLLKKGGTVKGYKAGGQVKKDKSPNSGMITKRGWGASRKT